MPHPIFLIAPLLLGFSGGLRSLTPAAVLLIAIRLGVLSLDGTWLAFLSSTPILIVIVALAIGELIGDKLSFAPNRTAWLGLSGRVISGAICGAALIASLSGNSLIGMFAGTSLGITGAMTGTFSGFYARTRIASSTGTRDLYIALAEDLLAIAIAILVIRISVN